VLSSAICRNIALGLLMPLASGCGGGAGKTGSGGTSGGMAGTSGMAGMTETGGSSAGGAGTSGTGGAIVDAAQDASTTVDADPDAPPCSPTNYLFDCAEYFACDSQTLRCTKRCSSSQPCHGGCCKDGTCQLGTEQTACGHEGASCGNCTSTLLGGATGSRCRTYPTMDSPPLPGGYCSCNDFNDCPTSQTYMCVTQSGTSRCCFATNATCSRAMDCCTGVCAVGRCG
jgi:hypothetical protein